MKIAFSWDDGALEDQKLFVLHEKYKIPGIFFVPTRNCEGRDVITPKIMREAESKYVSFGGHTDNHRYLTQIPITDVDAEILHNKEYLEDALGHKITDFCLPGGKHNTEIVDIVYRYYKTIRTADTMNFSYRGGLLKPTIHFYPRGNKSLFGNALRNKSYAQAAYVATHYNVNYFDLVTELIEREQYNDESIIIIWGHSWELEQYQLWDDLEKIMRLDCVKNNVVEYKKIDQ